MYLNRHPNDQPTSPAGRAKRRGLSSRPFGLAARTLEPSGPPNSEPYARPSSTCSVWAELTRERLRDNRASLTQR